MVNTHVYLFGWNLRRGAFLARILPVFNDHTYNTTYLVLDPSKIYVVLSVKVIELKKKEKVNSVICKEYTTEL